MPTINIRIIFAYLMPILEYCAIVWYPTKTTHITKLEKPLRFATRAYLRTPYRTDHAGYLKYQQRLHEMKLTTIEERRTIAVLAITSKIITQQTHSKLLQSLTGFRNHNTRFRNPIIFKYTPSAVHGPLKTMMETSNRFSNVINFDANTTNAIKTIARNLFHTSTGKFLKSMIQKFKN